MTKGLAGPVPWTAGQAHAGATTPCHKTRASHVVRTQQNTGCLSSSISEDSVAMQSRMRTSDMVCMKSRGVGLHKCLGKPESGSSSQWFSQGTRWNEGQFSLNDRPGCGCWEVRKRWGGGHRTVCINTEAPGALAQGARQRWWRGDWTGGQEPGGEGLALVLLGV